VYTAPDAAVAAGKINQPGGRMICPSRYYCRMTGLAAVAPVSVDWPIHDGMNVVTALTVLVAALLNDACDWPGDDASRPGTMEAGTLLNAVIAAPDGPIALPW